MIAATMRGSGFLNMRALHITKHQRRASQGQPGKNSAAIRVNLGSASAVYYGMNISMRQAIVPFLAGLALAAPSAARDFNGFYTPEFVRGHGPPYVPVSTTASLDLGQRVSGRLSFRELGSFRAEGARSGSGVELALHDGAGALAGRGRGTISAGRLDLELELLDEDGQVRSRGRLSLETVSICCGAHLRKGRPACSMRIPARTGTWSSAGCGERS